MQSVPIVSSPSRLPFVLPVAFILVSAFVLAASANRVLDAVLTSTIPEPSFASSVRGAPQDPIPGASLDTDRMASLTGVKVPATSKPAPPPRADVDSDLPYVVVGTLVSERSELSLAAVIDSRDGRAHTWKIGDAIDDAVVAEIDRARVIVERDGRREIIGRSARPGAGVGGSTAFGPTPSSSGPPRAVEGSAALAPSLRQTGPNQWSVSRADVDGVIGKIMLMGTDARITPSFKNGVANGFKLNGILPGSLYSRMGIQNGDVLSGVNGITIDSPEKALQAHAQLKDATRLDITVLRNDTPVTQTYRIE